ncbi:MAG: sugar phosphate isomerase/epimerase family protein [Pseudomonadota bacterium]|jgi:sugar phosphate isomerase/epimerase
MSLLAISNIAWTAAEDRSAYELLGKLGIKGLEVAPTRIHPDIFSAPKSLLKDFRKMVLELSGAEIVSLQSLHFGRPDLSLFGEDKKATELYEHTKKAVDLAVALGARNLVFGSPKNRLIPPAYQSNAWDEAVDFFSRLGTYAESYDVTISIEPNPEAYGANFITRTAEAIKIVKEINLNNFRINLDLGTCWLNQENPAAFVLEQTNIIGHIHISEPMLGAIPGQVDMETHKLLSDAIKRSNYGKWISLEMRAISGDNLGCIRQALEFALDIYT